MSFLFLIQGITLDMDFCQTVHKISSFITHYQDHKVYGDSFFEYVVEDYIENDTKNQEHHSNSDKDNIPVHSHHQGCHSIVYIINTNTALIDRLKFDEVKQLNLHSVHFNSRNLESLFQPPKV